MQPDERDVVPGLIVLLRDCVEGGASVGFMWPLSIDDATSFWHGVLDRVGEGERIVFVAEDDDGRVVGTVQLLFAAPENQPHRGDIAKMLVHPDARRRGLGEALMRAAEDAARAAGRSLLVLDTAGDEATRLYERMGWQRVGTVPNYALWPDGRMAATTYFFRELAP